MNLFDGKHIPFAKACILILVIPATYRVAAINSYFIGLIPIYFLSLLYITKVKKYRHAFYLAWVSSLLAASLHVNFFLNIFGAGAVILWIILSFWPAIFVLLSKILIEKTSRFTSLISIPALFLVLEIISCEIYTLRFSWGNPGYMTFNNPDCFGIKYLGIYGFSLVILALSLLIETSKNRKLILSAFVLILTSISFLKIDLKPAESGPRITGIQLEFPEQIEALNGLDKALKAEPGSEIFMLSEYTFENGIPEPVKNWCRKNRKYLITGTTFTTKDEKFYNTATVVNPKGEIEFKQAKAQPIQFFRDGLPAPEQKLWESAWGKIGLCICYDLSYSKVIDELVKQGAQALLVPTMDVESWGKSEHELHARVAPIRAAEYGIPIFKVASSGISQSVNKYGQVLASAPFPGQGEIISTQLTLSEKGSKPIDRYLFWPAILLCLYGFFQIFAENKNVIS